MNDNFRRATTRKCIIFWSTDAEDDAALFCVSRLPLDEQVIISHQFIASVRMSVSSEYCWIITHIIHAHACLEKISDTHMHLHFIIIVPSAKILSRTKIKAKLITLATSIMSQNIIHFFVVLSTRLCREASSWVHVNIATNFTHIGERVMKLSCALQPIHKSCKPKCLPSQCACDFDFDYVKYHFLIWRSKYW